MSRLSLLPPILIDMPFATHRAAPFDLIILPHLAHDTVDGVLGILEHNTQLQTGEPSVWILLQSPHDFTLTHPVQSERTFI